MKVSQLIGMLQDALAQNGDVEIITATDDEGNYFRKIHYVDEVYCDPTEHYIEDVFDSFAEAEDYGLINVVPAILIG